MARSTEHTRARRFAIVPICAVFWASLCLVVSEPGCLNPMPDDYPSSDDSDPETRVPVPRETCSDNPLLAECLPSSGVAGNPADPSMTGPDLVYDPIGQDAGAPRDAGADAAR